MKKAIYTMAIAASMISLASCGEGEAEMKVKEEAAKVEKMAKENIQKLDEAKKALDSASSDLDAALEGL